LLLSTATVQTKPHPILYLNLRPFFVGGLFVLLFASPFLRGLFFQPELLEAHMLTAAVFALAWYDQVLRREISFLRFPLDYAVVALIAAYALSLLTAVHLRPAVGELLKVINYFMVYWIVVRAVQKEKDLDRLLAVCFAAATGVAVIGLVAAAGYSRFPGVFSGPEIASTFQYENALAAYMVVFSIVGLALSVKSERAFPKVFYAVGNFLLLVVLLSTLSRGGWIVYPLGLATLFAGLPGAYRWRAAYHLIIFLGCGLAATYLFLPRVLAGHGREALMYLLVLAAVTAVLQYAYHRLGLWLGRDGIEDRTRRLVAACGFLYLAVVVSFYLIYVASTLPSVLFAVLPVRVAQQAETIVNQSTSLPERLVITSDALKIAADYPLTGAGGGGWNALYHRYQSDLYWTTEAHNYFAQTLVEAGTLGLLAVLVLWGCFVCLVVRLWRRTGREGGVWISLWAAAVAAFTLGVHSAFDFDLSFAALGILLWALFGAVRAGEGLTKRTAGSRDTGVPYPTGRRLALTAVAATLGAALLFVPAASLHAAGIKGALGARAVLKSDLDAAERYYMAAVRLDPLTASYPADLAQVYAVQALKKDDAAKHFRALAQAQKAALAEPYNPQVRANLVNVYLLLKEADLAAREAEAMLQTNPLLPGNYEILGRVCIAAARQNLERARVEQARVYLDRAMAVPQIMAEKSAEVKKSSRRYAKGDLPPLTPGVQLAAGQAQYLSGRYAEARQSLQDASRDEKVGAEAKFWLAAAYHRLGEGREAQALLAEMEKQSAGIRKSYQELLILPPIF
jgi:O-antigen ligase